MDSQNTFHRDPSTAFLGGIIGPLAQRMGIDVVLARCVIGVLATIAPHIVIPAYLICWAVAPAKPQR